MNQPPNIPQHTLPKNAGLATTSLVLGLSSLLLSVLTGIPAIICGHIALSKIKAAQGALTGNGQAIAGLVLGYISIPLIVVGAVAAMTMPVIMKQRQKTAMLTATSNAKQIFYALTEYDEKNGHYPKELITLEKEGYTELLEGLEPSRGNNWIYFSGYSSKSAPDQALLASPKPFGNKYVILFNNGSVKQVKKSDYTAVVNAPSNQE